jgi:methionyl-tRNA formyltransferase
MKVVVIGAVRFTLEMLKVMHTKGVDIYGVVTVSNNSINSDYIDLAPFCDENKIQYYKTDDINSYQAIAWIRSLEVDVIFCLGWSRLIKREVLELTPTGVIGYHPAALPKNRGRHPLIWALVLGLDETASTFFFMDEGADTGDILSQEKISITSEDDAGTLYRKMIQTAKAQLLSIIPAFMNGTYKRLPQDHSKANIWRKRRVEDGEIDWRMSACSIHNLVRGLTHPYIGAHFFSGYKEFKVWKSRVSSFEGFENIEPGKVIKINSSILTVRCGFKCIDLLEVEPEIFFRTGEYL